MGSSCERGEDFKSQVAEKNPPKRALIFLRLTSYFRWTRSRPRVTTTRNSGRRYGGSTGPGLPKWWEKIPITTCSGPEQVVIGIFSGLDLP